MKYYVTAKDLQEMIPNLTYDNAIKYINKAREIMKEKNYVLIDEKSIFIDERAKIGENVALGPNVVVGEYAIPTADSTLWTPASEMTANACGIKILMEQPLVEGAVNTDTKYFCMVEQVGTGITA